MTSQGMRRARSLYPALLPLAALLLLPLACGGRPIRPEPPATSLGPPAEWPAALPGAPAAPPALGDGGGQSWSGAATPAFGIFSRAIPE